MPPDTPQPPFGDAPQGQLALQAAPAPKQSHQPKVTHALAERHEALWLRLQALHKDTLALGAKRFAAPVPEPLRIAAEGLLSDATPFLPKKQITRLPVAAPEMGGLAVQLGQALALLEAWESQRSFFDPTFECRMWRVEGARQPIMRLKPPAAALPPPRRDMTDLRAKLVRRIEGKVQGDFERGFRAGRQARDGKPVVEIEAEARQTYPRIRLLD